MKHIKVTMTDGRVLRLHLVEDAVVFMRDKQEVGRVAIPGGDVCQVDLEALRRMLVRLTGAAS